MQPTSETVLKDFYTLSVSEQNIVKSELLNPSFVGFQSVKDYVAENRFASGRVCPHCGSTHVSRNGHRKDGTQKYICVDCRKSFVSTSNSIAAGTRKSIIIWEKYLDCMLNGFSVRKSAQICHIHKNTAFIWRHKILDALTHMMENIYMDGIIEADEAFFNVSYKGNHKNSSTFTMPRPAHHRGNDVHTRGLSNEKVCVPCAVNRTGLSIAKVSNLARIKIEGLKGVFDGKIEEGSVIVSDKASAYKQFSKDNKLSLCSLKSGTDSYKGIYHLQHINSYHSQLKGFISRFKGVSTKYLNNYLVWNNYVNYTKMEYDEKKKRFLKYVFSIQHTITSRKISYRDTLPLLA